ncbi:MAG: alcohol dehydrogenase catalytic domain-containing protein [Armatimonadota bacterium]|nr:alcohol dehydrogenase catalytic domain-containing protein [bacterium]
MLTAILEDLGKFIIKDTPEPPAPGSSEVQIRVERIGICGSDISAYYGRHPYIHCPIILGHEFSGTIEKLGADASGLAIGDRCTIVPHLKCGVCPACQAGRYNQCGELRVLGAQADGAFTELINVPAEMVVNVPDSVSMEQAAMVEPGAVGYHAARRADPKPHETVVIFGAGPIGMFTMQSVKALGAEKVISVDKDTDRLALASSLGVDGTIDLLQETLDAGLDRLVGGAANVDVFIDCVGFSGDALNNIIRVARRGIRVVVAGVLESTCNVPLLPDFVEHELTMIGSTMYVKQDFADVLELMAQGKIRIDGIITHHWKLSDVKELYKMIDARSEKFFKIVLSVE